MPSLLDVSRRVRAEAFPGPRERPTSSGLGQTPRDVSP